jgi:HAD superfamily hydrolase (TIGR01490 family)
MTHAPMTGSDSVVLRAEPFTTRLAIFDLDRTLVPGSSLAPLARLLADAGLISRRRLAGAAVQHARFAARGASDADVQRLRAEALSVVAGLDRAVLLPLTVTVGARVAGTATAAARLLLQLHRERGDFCVVLSASPQELVEVVGEHLGAHRSIGTRGEVVDGRFTGRLDGPFCYGPGKLQRLTAALGPVDLTSAYAYADSGSDVPLLEACGNPVAVQPDRRLRTVARARGWPVIRLA